MDGDIKDIHILLSAFKANYILPTLTSSRYLIASHANGTTYITLTTYQKE